MIKIMIRSKKDKINIIIYDNYIVIRGEEKNQNKGIRIDNFKGKKIDLNKLSNMDFNNSEKYLNDLKIEYSEVEFL